MLLLHSNTTRSAVPGHVRSVRQTPCHQVHGQDVTLRIRVSSLGLGSVQRAHWMQSKLLGV